MGRYLCSEKIDITHVIDEIFDFTKLGGISLPNILTKEAQSELVAAIELAKPHFKEVQREKKSGVIQEMKTLYLERVAVDKLPLLLTDRIHTLTTEYSEIYQELAKAGNFTSPRFNSIGIHWYPVGSAGITPHQDYAADTNLIASFIVAGSAPFFICRDRQKKDASQIAADPGALIFMRAARIEEEQPSRPFHYLVGPIEEERYSILLRYRAEEKMDKLKAEQYNNG